MTVETSSSVFIPQVLAPLVEAGFAETPVLLGSGAVTTDLTMPYGSESFMMTVNIPYVTAPNAWTVYSGTDAGTLSTVTVGIGNAAGNSAVPETSTVDRAGIMIDFNTIVRNNPLDPYGQARKQMLAGWGQAMEDKLITVASDSTGWSSYTLDVSAAADPTLSVQVVVSGAQQLGSEGFRDPFVLGMVHSAVMASMLNRTNALGQPWMVEKTTLTMPDGSIIYRLLPFGTLLYCSDKIAPSGGVYTSVFCRKNSLALWVNPNLSARSVQVPSTDSQIDGLNSYFAAHRYKRVSGKSKPGVILIKHKI